MLYKFGLVLILSTCFLHVEAGCNESIYAPSSLLESPHYPDMYDVGNCYYFIKVPSGKSLVLFWLHFDVGEYKINDQCRGDSMTVYDGTMFSPFRQWTFCGSDDVLNITSTSNMMTLWLKSNTSHQFDGFQVQYDSFDTPCSTQSLGSNFGTFHSPNFPQTFPVPSCNTYKVQVPPDRVIQLTWNQFDIGSNGLLSSCMNYVQLYDQSIRSENEIFKACSKHKLPKHFTSSGNVVYIQFMASVMSPFSKGFQVSYVSMTQSLCNINLHTSAGAMTIPDNPTYSHQNLDCIITVNIKNVDHIILRWIEFGPQLFQDTSSCGNNIAIYNGIANSTNLVTKICSSSNSTTILVKSSHFINIHYRIQNYNRLKNFRFFYLGVTSQQLQRKILFSNASCEDIEWYYDAPFGNVAIERTSSCAVQSKVMAVWLLAVIISGASLLSTILIIAAGCLLARRLARRRHRYRQL